MTGLDYSQKRLISAPFNKGGKHDKHTERLQFYAFMTGLMSTLISLVSVIVQAIKYHH